MSLSHRMHKAFDGSVSLQNEVKDIITKHDQTAAIELIIEGVTTFKEEIERSLKGVSDTEAVRTYRKKANNIINDVSRICQKEVGVSIKCKYRKDGYVYEACDYIPRPKPASSASTSVPVPSPKRLNEVRIPATKWPEDSKACSDAGVIEQTIVNLAAKQHPVATIIRIVEEWGAEEFMKSVAEAKAALDS